MENVSPVTEADVRSFMERIATSFVAYAAQSRDLSTMRDTVSDLQRRLEDMQAENAKVRSDLTQTWELVQSVEKERDEAKRYIESEVQAHADTREALSNAKQSITSQEQRIAELETALREAQANANNYKQINTGLEVELRNARSDNAYWRDRAYTAEKQALDLGNELVGRDRTIAEHEEKLKVVRSLFEPKVEVNPTPEVELKPNPSWRDSDIQF